MVEEKTYNIPLEFNFFVEFPVKASSPEEADKKLRDIFWNANDDSRNFRIIRNRIEERLQYILHYDGLEALDLDGKSYAHDSYCYEDEGYRPPDDAL